jgi:HlyD family secretion protein
MAQRDVLQPRPEPVERKAQAQVAAPPPKSASRRRFVLPLVMLVVLAAIGFTVWRLFFASPSVPGNIVVLSGRIEGDDSAVSPKAGGRILEIRFREGDSVNAGDIIAVLIDEQLKAREAQGVAALRQAQAKVKSAREQVTVLEEQRREEEATVQQQEASYELALFDKEAYTRLAKTGAVSERQGRQAQSTADQQAAAVAAAKRRLAGIRMQIAQQQADIASADATANQFRAQLEEARENWSDLTVRAPFTGTVATRTAEPGEVVTAGTPLMTLIDLSKVYLRGFVPEGQIGKIKVGQPAHVYLDSNPQQPIDAYVMRIDPEATFTPENTYFREDRVKQVVGLKLELKGALGFAKPGMPADGEILVAGDRWPERKRK